MKKISLLLALLTCATVTHNSFTISIPDLSASEMPSSYPPQEENDKQEHNDEYDIKKEVRKFRKKHGKPKIDQRASHHYEDYNSILDSIEKHGLAAINSNKTESQCEGMQKSNLLDIAIEWDYQPLVKFLLQHGAHLNKATKYLSSAKSGYTILYPIEQVESVKMAQYLEDNGADLSVLFDKLDSSHIKNNPKLREYVEKKKSEYHNSNKPTDAKIQQ